MARFFSTAAVSSLGSHGLSDFFIEDADDEEEKTIIAVLK